MNGRILRLGILFAAAVIFMALVVGCSNWVLGVIQSFGTQNGAKITTVAGNGTGGYAGDGGPATSAELHQPYAVAVDPAGNLYIADGVNCLIRMVSPSGTITTVVGDHSRAGQNYGDGGLATLAGLYDPVGVAVDASGNIYISDSGNQVIREVTKTTGDISTAVSGSVGSPAATLVYPYGITVDSSGDLFITDLGNSRILEDISGIISTVAGMAGSAGYTGDGGKAIDARLNSPTAVAVDSAGNIYIADGLNFVIRKVDNSSNHIITTVAGNGLNGYSGDGGPATAAEIEQPWGVAVDSSGTLYISEINSVVRKVDAASGIISTVAGNVHLGSGYGGDGNVATAAMLSEPWGLAIDNSGNLLIADFVNNRVRKVSP